MRVRLRLRVRVRLRPCGCAPGAAHGVRYGSEQDGWVSRTDFA